MDIVLWSVGYVIGWILGGLLVYGISIFIDSLDEIGERIACGIHGRPLDGASLFVPWYERLNDDERSALHTERDSAVLCGHGGDDHDE